VAGTKEFWWDSEFDCREDEVEALVLENKCLGLLIGDEGDEEDEVLCCWLCC